MLFTWMLQVISCGSDKCLRPAGLGQKVLEQKATVSIGWEASIIVITPFPPVLRILSPDALSKKFPPFCGIRRFIICNIKSLVSICDAVSSFWVECGLNGQNNVPVPFRYHQNNCILKAREAPLMWTIRYKVVALGAGNCNRNCAALCRLLLWRKLYCRCGEWQHCQVPTIAEVEQASLLLLRGTVLPSSCYRAIPVKQSSFRQESGLCGCGLKFFVLSIFVLVYWKPVARKGKWSR
jgi:hypothetical protein